jgi:hypothetical protein
VLLPELIFLLLRPLGMLSWFPLWFVHGVAVSGTPLNTRAVTSVAQRMPIGGGLEKPTLQSLTTGAVCFKPWNIARSGHRTCNSCREPFLDSYPERSSTRSGPLPWWELLGKMKVVPFLPDWKRVCSYCGHHSLGATLEGTIAAKYLQEKTLPRLKWKQ